MEWFGVTYYGFTDPIKDMVRSDYHEPEAPEDLIDLEKKGQLRKPFYELLSELDCYVGRIDGYAYRSNDRLIRMRKKGTFKPVGPLDMYNYPGCSSMDMGWWTIDPALEGENWWLPDYHYGQPVSDNTKFVNYALSIDKVFRL